jgi:hypothetical protein
MDADSELVTTLSGQSRVVFDEAVLHIDDLACGIGDPANSMMLPSPVRFNPPVMGNWPVDEIAAQGGARVAAWSSAGRGRARFCGRHHGRPQNTC